MDKPIEVVRAELAAAGIDTGAATAKVLAAVRTRSAASRVRRVEAGERQRTVYGFDGELMDDFMYRMLENQATADLRVLARHYLAEHPDDDGEPVTAEWLRSVGFLPDGEPDRPDVPLSLTLWYGRVEEEVMAGEDDGRHLLIDAAGDVMIEEYEPSGRVTSSVMLPRVRTRADVRRLLAALGT